MQERPRVKRLCKVFLYAFIVSKFVSVYSLASRYSARSGCGSARGLIGRLVIPGLPQTYGKPAIWYKLTNFSEGK